MSNYINIDFCQFQFYFLFTKEKSDSGSWKTNLQPYPLTSYVNSQ